MVRIKTQKALRECRRVGFCYLCGKPFAPTDEPNRDHVPPKAVFMEGDRLSPLILPTHPDCNEAQSGEDELVSQFVSALHGEYPRPQRRRLEIVGGYAKNDGSKVAFTRNINLVTVVWRWIRGFHAALYHEHLAIETEHNVHAPFPTGRQQDDRVSFDQLHPQQFFVVEELKKNRLARNLDAIECYGGQCVYECVFVKSDDGRPICMCALKLYEWEKLADPRAPCSHGCVGVYEPSSGIPTGAACGTVLQFPFDNRDPLDPFSR